MWKSDTMDFVTSLVVSGLGLFIVILALSFLALTIVALSKTFMMLGLGVKKKVTSDVQSVSKMEELDEESYAVLMAAVCEEIQQPPDKFRIIQIKEIY